MTAPWNRRRMHRGRPAVLGTGATAAQLVPGSAPGMTWEAAAGALRPMFTSGGDEYACFPSPALFTDGSGALLAFCEARRDSCVDE